MHATRRKNRSGWRNECRWRSDGRPPRNHRRGLECPRGTRRRTGGRHICEFLHTRALSGSGVLVRQFDGLGLDRVRRTDRCRAGHSIGGSRSRRTAFTPKKVVHVEHRRGPLPLIRLEVLHTHLLRLHALRRIGVW